MDYVTKEHTDKVEERMIWPNVWSPFSSSLDLVEQTCLPCRMGCVKKKTQVGQLPGRLGGFGTSKKHLQKHKTCDLPVFYSILVGSFPASIFFLGGLAIKVRTQLLGCGVFTGVGGQIGGQSQ